MMGSTKDQASSTQSWRVNKVESADAKVGDSNRLRKLQIGETFHGFHTERIVAEKDVADTSDEDLHNGSTSSTEKKNR